MCYFLDQNLKQKLNNNKNRVLEYGSCFNEKLLIRMRFWAASAVLMPILVPNCLSLKQMVS